jgi:hypothetical protein
MMACSARHDYERTIKEKRVRIEEERREMEMILGAGA